MNSTIPKDAKPVNTKERILEAAIMVFGHYGYYGATTRMIAQESNINISALHYHWGDKRELYEAAVIYVNKQINRAHRRVSEAIQGLARDEQIGLSVKMMSEFLFCHPEYSALVLNDSLIDLREERQISDTLRQSTLRNYQRIAEVFGASQEPSQGFLLKLMGILHMFHNLVVGEGYFISVLGYSREQYVETANEILRSFYRAILSNE